MRRIGRIGLIVALVGALAGVAGIELARRPARAAEQAAPPAARSGVPRLVDLGSSQCIPCKLMAPILDGMKKELAGKLAVDFIDVGQKENLPLARQYGIRVIPTQVLLDANGKELWRHEGFISRYGILDKFREQGCAFAADALKPAFSRMEPARADDRPKEGICFLCDGDIDARTQVTVRTDKGDVRLCGPHCYFILYSCLTEDRTGFEKKVFATDWATEAVYLYGLDAKSGRPWVKAFADRAAAEKERTASGGSVVGLEALQDKELAHRCGFCDRACYPADAARVIVGGVHTWGCCSHCAMGVAARTGQDIEVRQPDRLTGQMVVVRTLGGYVQAIDPPTAVAWFGMRKKPDGTFGSAGCFHQGFFANLENLKTWAERNPAATGRMITIDQALGDKMKMTPAQIAKACKVGECSPK